MRALLERLDAGLVLVMGKGGVGKTTTAGALAVLSADRGERVHLLSLDPAHNLGDLFRQPVGSSPRACDCCEGLVLEEFDAPAAMRRWADDARGPVGALMRAATWLDEEDVRDFLEGPLPGGDELTGALRVLEVVEEREGRIIVDAAPTGHALRFLDAGEVVSGWHAALRAMVRKVSLVASSFAGARVRPPSEEFVAELGERAARFSSILRSEATCALLVSRPETPVIAEARRLRGELAARGIRVGGEVRIGGARERVENGERTVVPAVELDPPPVECEGLRRWLGAAEPVSRVRGRQSRDGPRPAGPVGPTPAAPARIDSDPGVPPSSVRQALPGSRTLLLFAGKGGVGKTTCAVACALTLAESRRVDLLGTGAGDGGGLLGAVSARFGNPGSTGSEDAGDGPTLRVVRVDAEAELRSFRRRHREGLRRLVRDLGLDEGLPMDRAVVESVLELTPPGMDELFALAALTEAASGDVQVVDTSPTGHFLRLLGSPDVVLHWTHSLIRLLLKYREVTGLGDLGRRLLGFSRRVRGLQELLTDPERAGVCVVTRRGPLVEAETRRLCEALGRSGTGVAAVIVNRDSGAPGRPELEGPCGGDVPLILTPDLRDPPEDAVEAREFFDRWKRVA